MHKCAKKCMCNLFHLLIFVEITTHEFDVGKKPFFLSNTCEENFAKVLSKNLNNNVCHKKGIINQE